MGTHNEEGSRHKVLACKTPEEVLESTAITNSEAEKEINVGIVLYGILQIVL